MSVTIRTQSNFPKLTKFLYKRPTERNLRILQKYGKRGVAALKAATPRRTGETANSWDFRIRMYSTSAKLTFFNTNKNDGEVIAILLQLGHGTGTGGWVEGVDYINPALRPIFEGFAKEIWEEVTKV